MALTSTLLRAVIELSDIDRSVYEQLDFRIAQHPSEENERVVVRILARALAHEEGMEFGRGLSNPEDPAIFRSSLSNEFSTWIDVGAPSAERIHKASKRADKVILVTDKPQPNLKKEWSSRKIHQAEEVQVISLEPQMVQGLAATIGRKVTWFITIHDGVLRVSSGEENWEAPAHIVSLTEFLG